MLPARLLRMMGGAVPWSEVATRLRPFVARRVPAREIDDVLQDVLVRLHRGVGAIRDDDRFAAWAFQIARNAIADNGRARARHPLPASPNPPDEPVAAAPADEDREAATALASCISLFVAQLASPYREAITLVELEGLTAREAAALVGISVSGMKSRVQRGRGQLRALFERCCAIAVDARGKVTEFAPRAPACDRCG